MFDDPTILKAIDLPPLRGELAAAGDYLTFSQEGLTPAISACADVLAILIDAQQYIPRLTFRQGFAAISSRGQLAAGLLVCKAGDLGR